MLGLLPRPLLHRWLTESARWLVMVGRTHQALRELQKVARINGKKEEGDKLDIEVKGSARVPQGVPGVFYRGPLNIHPMGHCPSVVICIHRPLCILSIYPLIFIISMTPIIIISISTHPLHPSPSHQPPTTLLPLFHPSRPHLPRYKRVPSSPPPSQSPPCPSRP